MLPKGRSALQKLSLLFLLWTFIEAHISQYRIARAEREARARTHLIEPTRVFIASLHWNNEKILRSDWNKGVVDLVNTFGADNVFVSVYESGSWDDSKGALRELDQELEKTGVGKKIVLDDETHKDLINGPAGDEGWITIPDGRRMPRRIPYLSRLRNLSLQPLLELAENGTTFDHVLFLGDVIFSVCQLCFNGHDSRLLTHRRYPTSSTSSNPTTAATLPPAPSTSASPPTSTTPSPCATPAATSTPRRRGPTSAPPNPARPWPTPSPSPSPAAGTASVCLPPS
jgi:hypothetical protein